MEGNIRIYRLPKVVVRTSGNDIACAAIDLFYFPRKNNLSEVCE